MKGKMDQRSSCRCGVVFCPALTPLEAAVLPAQEGARIGALSLVRTAWEAGCQRTKICVR